MAISLLAVLIAACEPGNRAGGGAVMGAVAGGVIGNQFGSGAGRACRQADGTWRNVG
jgi:uncharacterized protein YcfJ